MKANVSKSEKDFAKRSSPVLFVEGGGKSRFDVQVMKALFDSEITIEPLGCSDGVKFAANAFQSLYPHYFFIIDRDTKSREEVEKSWNEFGEQNKRNLLILHKREIENYFLSPEFLTLSQFFVKGKTVDDIKNRIMKEAKKRLYLDALNFVVISIREELKSTGITTFRLAEIDTKEKAVGAIDRVKQSIETFVDGTNDISADEIRERFEQRLTYLCGNDKSCDLTFGKGEWVNQMEGKEILHAVINSNNLFRVPSGVVS